MPELIIVCAAAAADRDSGAESGESLGPDPSAVREALRGGAFARAFRRASCAVDESDDALLPRELPEERWWRDTLQVPDADSIEAYAALAHDIALPCLRLTPAHVLIGLDHVRLAEPSALELDDAQARALAAAATPVFAEQGLALDAPDPMLWFASGEPQPHLRARSWNMAAGRNIDAHLPSGPDARLWRKLLNEVQMTWFEHPVNREREARGQLPVNMLWLDGRAGGALPQSDATIVGRGPVIAGLARASGARHLDPGGELPGRRVLAEHSGQGDLIVDVGEWSEARRTGDAAAWLDAWRRFDDWLGRIGLDRGADVPFGSVRVVLTGERRRVELSRREGPHWRFWRRIDPLAIAL